MGELIRRRRQAEQTCETLTQVLEATSDGFVALDAAWCYTYVNAHAGEMFNRDPASLIGKHIWTEFPEAVGQPFQQEYERAAADGTPHEIEAYYAPYGKWLENRIYPYAGGLAIFFQDVTERHTAEARLRESEQRYRSLFDHHPDAVYSFDREGHFVSANAACEGLTGYSLKELIGKPFAPLIVPENRVRTLERFREVNAEAVILPGLVRHQRNHIEKQHPFSGTGDFQFRSRVLTSRGQIERVVLPTIHDARDVPARKNLAGVT